ncbi:MAG TPA: MarR family winged helix-turn-helix transcriptional regulator [Dehalococcoidia bacterium]|nr:MarR family winged helix-turn-helix transcriptional regulator [Dehalococcoidia bacterium]
MTLQFVPQFERASHRIGSYVSRAALGVSQAEANILARLEAQGPCSIAELHQAFGLKRSSLTSVLDRLSEKGLAERSVSPTDRRSFTVRLTPNGRALARRVIAALADLEGRVVSAVSREDLDGFRRVLAAISEAPDQVQISRDDEDFLAAFEAGEIPGHEFGHEDHLRMAWLYLRRHDLPTATERAMVGLRRFLASSGMPGLYNETLTQLWVKLVYQAYRQSPETTTFEEFIARSEHLLDRGLPYKHYDRKTLMSEPAKQGWVEPDRVPLPW